MSIVGLVGGLGPESTIDYYRRTIEVWQRDRPGSSPSIVIDSLDVQRGLHLAGNDHAGLTAYLLESIRRLEGAGVSFVAMTANTAHLVFDELAAKARVPLLSIVDVAADEAERQHLKRLILLGTRFTMEAPFYPAVFARRGMKVFPPSAEERAWVHDCYVNQLLEGDFRDDTRERLMMLVMRLRQQHEADALILGGTELPLLLKSATVAGLPTLDTTALHVRAIVDRLARDGAN